MKDTSMRTFGIKYSTVILRGNCGFLLAGSIPVELVDKRWKSEPDVIADLLKIGIKRFQLSDCSWYEMDTK